MKESQFWEIIESSGSPDKFSSDEQCENIVKLLFGMRKDELIAFSNIHRVLLHRAYTWPMLKASFIIISYISDDVFEDFRNWVILNGKDRYFRTIENPEYISSYIMVDDAVEEVTGEVLLFVCEEAWDGDIDDLEEGYIYPQDPIIGDDWPKKEKLEKEFPTLFSKFWDEENIRTLHGG